MKKFIYSACCLASLAIFPCNGQDTVQYRCASVEEAKQLIRTEDGYTRNWSPFDIVSRLENQEGKKEDLIELSAEEVTEWTDTEKKNIRRMMHAINDTIRKYGYKIPFPGEIVLIKSPMKAEGGAGGYTRSNWIMLVDGFFEKINQEFQQHLLLHETFHILTRNNPGFKKQMYGTIGFSTTEEELEFPEDLRDRRISNPDVSRYDSYATFTIDGRPRKCAMILYANKPYTTGKFFQYMNIGFVPLDNDLKPVRQGGSTVVYSFDKVSDFNDKVGMNTRYIIHPEEILADNFVIAFLNKQDVPTPGLKEKIRCILKQPSK